VKSAHRIVILFGIQEVRLVGENIEPGVLNMEALKTSRLV
jgi:hypothetical protein